MELGKVPPHDIEAEQAVIGSMLTDKDAVISAIEVLHAEDFYREDNKAIYDAILSLYAKGEPIDVITVKSELKTNLKLDSVGGIEYLASLPDKVPTTANVEQYIKIVEEKSILRTIIKVANDMLSLGYGEEEDIDAITDTVEKKVFNIMQTRNQRGYAPIKDILVDTFEEIERLYNNKGEVSGIPTGLKDLDYKLSGLHDSNLILIAARPAMGKTALGVNIATNVALKAKVPVLLFSLEMSKEEVANRILCSEALVDSRRVQTGQMDDKDWEKLGAALGPLSEAPIYIDDTASITISEIRAKCRKLQLEKNIGLVVIDYLQLISGSGKKNTGREQEVAEISRSLKMLAKELKAPVIALSQLSRAPEQRKEDHRPMLSDLRESGSIEQDADIVMFIYRDDYYNEESTEKNIAEIIVAKNRGGAPGTVKLAWLPDYTKFANLDRRYSGGEE